MRWTVALPCAALVLATGFVYRFVFAGEVLTAGDYYSLFIPDSALLLDYLHAGEWPLWNPYARMGQPFAATIQAQAFYAPRVVSIALFGPALGMTVLQMVHTVIAVLGVAWCLRPMVKGPWAAWLGGAMFGLSPMFISLTSPNLAAAASWSGWLVGAAMRGRWRSLALFVALSLWGGSPETTLWQLMLTALFSGRQWRLWGAVALGFGLTAQTLLPALELTAESIRGSSRLASGMWSLSWAQLPTALWPMFDLPRPERWGDDQWLIPDLFLGTLTVALAAWGAASRARHTRVLALAALSLLVFSLGKHVGPVRWLLEWPPFNWFRYPAKAYLGVGFCVAMLAGLGADASAGVVRSFHVKWRWAAGVVAAVVVLRFVSRPFIVEPLFRARAVEVAAWPLVVMGAAALVFCLLPAGRSRGLIWSCGLSALCLTELLLASRFVVRFSPDPLAIIEKPSQAATLLVPGQDGRVSAGVTADTPDFPLDGGEFTWASRDALVPTRFVEDRVAAVDGFGPPEPVRFERLARRPSRGFFDLAGVTHFVRVGPPPGDDLTVVAELNGGATLYASSTALPRAFVVQRSVIATDEAAFRAINDSSLGQPFRHTVFVAEGESREGPPCQSEVRRVPAGLLETAWDLEACADGFLVMTDSFFPGWRARVDGVAAPVLRADYAFRAVPVSKGPHSVRLRYWPATFTWGLVISALSACALALLRRRPTRAAATASPSASTP